MLTIPSRTTSRTIMAVAGSLLAIPLLVPAAGAAHAAYNAGVASLHLEGVADSCLPDFALPCTPGAGIGDANVLYVGQSEFDGEYVFNAVWGNGQSIDNLWVGAEISAECRTAHHLLGASIDGALNIGEFDGLHAWSFGAGIPGVETPFDWPLSVDTPNDKTLHLTRVALNVPLTELFDHDMIDGLSDADEVFEEGENVILDRMTRGMSEVAARGMPIDIETTVRIGADVACRWNGLIPAEYLKRRFAEMPITVRYLPIAAEAPAGDRAPTMDLRAAAEVVDVAMAVVPDPDDPCRLHLSGTIQTNLPTTVKYRFVDPFGQPSNTYSVDVDDTLVAFVSRNIDVPMLDGPDPTDDFAPATTVSDLDDYAGAAGDPSLYDGTFMIETVSPNAEVAADGFSVPYCTTPKVRVTDGIDGAPGDFTGGPNPTHADPTPSTTTTVPDTRRGR